MNKDWEDQIQKLSDDINMMKIKEKKRKLQVKDKTLSPDKKKSEKMVKFNLPEIIV